MRFFRFSEIFVCILHIYKWLGTTEKIIRNNFDFYHLLSDIVVIERLPLIAWIILRQYLNRVWMWKREKVKKLLWKFSQIYSTSFATKMAIKLHYSLLKRDRNVLAIKKIISSIVSIQHFTNIYHRRLKLKRKLKRCQPLYHN